jgi:hypothetical protein
LALSCGLGAGDRLDVPAAELRYSQLTGHSSVYGL